MAVVINVPFGGVEDLPRALRTAACAKDTVTFSLSAAGAIKVAQLIEDGLRREQLAAVRPGVPGSDAAAPVASWPMMGLDPVPDLEVSTRGSVVFSLYSAALAGVSFFAGWLLCGWLL